MAQATNLKRDVLVMNLEQELENQTQSGYGKSVSACSNEELYYSILQLSKKLMTASERIEGEKKIYYISAEFLIGKLLSNNLINLGIYDNLSKILEKNGKRRWILSRPLETAVLAVWRHAFWIPLHLLDFPARALV